MTNSARRVIVVALCVAVSSASLLTAQTRLRYRTYEMGDDRRTIARQVGVPSPPDLVLPRSLGEVEELTWRAQYVRRGTSSGDPVARLVFSFYEDQLFRIVIDYAADRTAGMTEGDLVAAVSKVYGPPAKRAQLADRVDSDRQRADDIVIAEWTESAYRVSLRTVPGQSTFRLILSSSRLEALARAAGTLLGPDAAEDRTPRDRANPLPQGGQPASAGETTRRANIASFIP